MAASAGGGLPASSLLYDPLGRLFQTTSASATTQFLYDGDALVAEYNGSGALTRRYVHGVGADVPLVEYLNAGTAAADRRNLLPDHQGSIVAISNNAGVRLGVNAYDEWGVPNAGNQGRFQYTGQIWLPELGMYHYKARMYVPGLGRFAQTDPVGYDDQINLYGYVGNDPVNAIDPYGMEGACFYSSSRCDYQMSTTSVVNFFAGMGSYARDIIIEMRHDVRLTGLAGEAGRNRALLVDNLAGRAFGWIRTHQEEARGYVGAFIMNNKAFIAGRIAAGAAVTRAGGPRAGASGFLLASAGGAVNQLNRIVGQLEGRGIDARSFSNSTLGAIFAAGAVGATANFNARTGDISVSVTNTETGSRIPETQSVGVCNVARETC